MRQTKVYGFEFGMVCLLLHFADIPTVSILFFADDMLTLAAKHLTYAQKQCKKQTNQELQKQFNGPCQTKSQSESDYKWMVLLIKLPNSQADTKKQAGETGVLLACTNIFFWICLAVQQFPPAEELLIPISLGFSLAQFIKTAYYLLILSFPLLSEWPSGFVCWKKFSSIFTFSLIHNVNL